MSDYDEDEAIELNQDDAREVAQVLRALLATNKFAGLTDPMTRVASVLERFAIGSTKIVQEEL